jgi:hypothetical protein
MLAESELGFVRPVLRAQLKLTAKGRALITRGFWEHATAMETVVSVLSQNERPILPRLLKKLGKQAAPIRR